jgi:hypothetical protein
MSTLLSSMLLLLSTVTTFNEPSDSLQQKDYDYYIQRSKSQKSAATVLLVTGVIIGTVTLLVAVGTALGDGLTTIVTLGTTQPEHHSYTIPLLLSVAAIVGAVPLYIAASRNKRKATAISLDAGIGSGPRLQQRSVKNYAYPSLSLKIRL